MKQFDSILVANRGEIALRVLRSAQQQGYRTIAVYSEADARSPHVQMADEAVMIGPAPVRESYLDMDKVLEAARLTGAQAIHPGYGFLSENAAFARACSKAGIVFIGPSPEAIEVMGNKAASKRRMLDAGVPCIPGYQDEDQSDEALMSAARDIGVPIMVKAAAGGGGRGMRLVESLDDLPVALASARSEAENAFGSAELILEKAVLRPRHVEIQVFGDEQGNVIHLGERDCSVQRRHQKVVEEAPCPVMTEALREAMGAAAVNAAKSIHYVGAGTVEFLLDADNNFYFLEMNTRLQVEHPVTEMITGQDLVAMQLRVAHGYPLPLVQEEVSLTGHAMEVRLYAEDPANDFLPATGTASVWSPAGGEGIRIDHGLLEGQDISPFYDPMVAKIIAWGEDRDIARRRLLRALQATTLLGVPSNREFLIDVLGKTAFAEGSATTAFIAEHYTDQPPVQNVPSALHLALAASLLYRAALSESRSVAVSVLPGIEGYSGARALRNHYQFGEEDKAVDVYLDEVSPGDYQIQIADQLLMVSWVDEDKSSVRVSCDGVQLTAQYSLPARGTVQVQLRGMVATMTNALAFTRGDEAAGGSGTIVAPMHGNLMSLLVSVGDRVEAGQDVAVMEAMKMEHRLCSPVAGEVVSVYASEGEQIASAAVVLEIAAEE
ncbi:acetyl-CoA carboxylase biotin carboxylase subunit [Pseudohalioglobus lutimaris]|uniref:Biotin carboxylase n=1 Tax=Pseudohalioglobus lutimaris TaxID=1737061 RepID=A0A2N5X8T5_9GAMM|nr:acetyl-CoA carboxylase biotin carboxylase subunit [Pseudohalioglobus lutimaris]PLW70894.1 3-methylcrotonyl-CoA carboxylase [Pseudohalioglobus lutimaris]